MRMLIPLGLMIALVFPGTTEAATFFVKHKNDDRRAEPASDAAIVYVFRPATMGAAVKTWSFADDALIGVSKGKAYSFARVSPGKHVLWSRAENISALELELEAGVTYYFKQVIQPGFGKARVKLVLITEEQATKLFKKCSYTEPTDEGRIRAVEIAAKSLEKARRKAAKASAEE